MAISLTEIIELKKVLDEKFNTQLHIHDTCGGQYFGVDNITPASKDYIEQYLQEKNYRVIFNSEMTEFHLEDIRLC